MKGQICLVPKLDGLGGMVSFQTRFIKSLQSKNISHTFSLTAPDNSAILVIGGTRQLWKLWRAKKNGATIVQRLNGMNWLHRVEKTPFKAYLRAETSNLILAFIRRFLADRIVYQSQFSQDWWEQVYKKPSLPTRVVYNGVDLETFSPEGPEHPPDDHFRILMVEGHLGSANARGLINAVHLVSRVNNEHHRSVELMVVGDVSDSVIARAKEMAPDIWITWHGVVPANEIPAINRSAHVLFSADLNAACPNSVIEALACGLPVVAFDTGALAELVPPGAGEIVPYGADHWQLEEPDFKPLAEQCVKILDQNQAYRQYAREWALKKFDLDHMARGYLEELGG